MLAHGLAKRRVGRHPGRVERGHVQLDEPPALLLGDPQPAVHVDEVREAQVAGEPLGPPNVSAVKSVRWST